MKNLNDLTAANDYSSELNFLSDDNIEAQIELNQDSEINFLLDQCSGDDYFC